MQYARLAPRALPWCGPRQGHPKGYDIRGFGLAMFKSRSQPTHQNDSRRTLEVAISFRMARSSQRAVIAIELRFASVCRPRLGANGFLELARALLPRPGRQCAPRGVTE